MNVDSQDVFYRVMLEIEELIRFDSREVLSLCSERRSFVSFRLKLIVTRAAICLCLRSGLAKSAFP